MVKCKHAIKNITQIIKQTYWKTLKIIYLQIVTFDNVSVAEI